METLTKDYEGQPTFYIRAKEKEGWAVRQIVNYVLHGSNKFLVVFEREV